MVMEMGVFTEQPASAQAHQQAGHAPAVALAIDQYISKLANMAKIDTKVERLAIDIAHKTNDHLLADGKAPNGLAAAYIYVASILLDVNILQRDVSSLSGVTEVTIRNRCKDILTSFKMTVTVRAQARQALA
jgi:transcription initiation factor TFIIB